MLHEDALSRQKWKSNCSFMMCWALLGICHTAPDRATSVPFSSTACLIIPPAQQWEKDGIHKPCTSPFLGSTKPLDPRAGREPTRQQDDVSLSLHWQAIASLVFPLYQPFLLPLSLSGTA